MSDEQTPTHGALDTESYCDVTNCSWIIRSVGYGHGDGHWTNLLSVFRMGGYDGVHPIQHEEALASPTVGLVKAVEVLQRAAFEESPGDACWA